MNASIRCLPLSPSFKIRSFRNLLPNIWSTRWRMDTREDGTWRQNQIAIDLFEKRSKKPKRSKSKKIKTESCAAATSKAKESGEKRKQESLDAIQKPSKNQN